MIISQKSKFFQEKALPALGLLLLLFVIFFSSKDNTKESVLSGEVVVTFTGEDFYPSDLNITEGTTIRFVNNSKKDFWPASNLHPSHTIYPEFDSMKALPPSTEWSFKFDKVGEWKFHDHLDSNIRGVVRVLGENELVSNKRTDCSHLDELRENSKLGCLEDQIRQISKEDGILESLKVLAEGFNSDVVFARNCHALSHIIGEEAYFKFSRGEDFNIDEKTAHCGYGFYHGFMERMFSLENDFSKARFFCKYLEEKTIGGRGGGELACYHGVGHGFVDGADKKAWGNERALTEPALALCDKISITEEEQYRCFSGVFNSLSIAYSNSLYGLKLDTKDPLWICRDQKEERYKLGCYTDMMVAVMYLGQDDLFKASQYMVNVDRKYIDRAMATLSSLAARELLRYSNFDEIINTCHSLPDYLTAACLKGFASGLMEFGEPKKEYIKANIYCGSSKLTKIERISCYDSVIDYASFTYPKERLKVVCNQIKAEFKSEITNNNCLRAN